MSRAASAVRGVRTGLVAVVLAGLSATAAPAQPCVGEFIANDVFSTTGFKTPGLENRQDPRPAGDRRFRIRGTTLAESDLELAMTDGPDAVRAGGTLTYELTATNESPCPATDLTIEDPLPAGTTFVSADAPFGACTTPAVGSPGTVSCHFPGPIFDFRTVTITVQVAPDVTEPLTNAATLASIPPDPDGGRDAAADTAVLPLVLAIPALSGEALALLAGLLLAAGLLAVRHQAS